MGVGADVGVDVGKPESIGVRVDVGLGDGEGEDGYKKEPLNSRSTNSRVSIKAVGH